MDKLIKYYNELKISVPPEVMTERILNTKPPAKANRISLKRPAVIAIAAAVLLVCGVSGAAAAGLLDFSSIFGDRLTADEQLASELLSYAKDFTWSVSDKDYLIELKGVTGSHSDMLMVYEIKRADGTPVTEHMTNLPEDDILCSAVKIDFKAPAQGSDCYNASDSNRYIINAEGNVEIYNKITTDGNIIDHYYSVEATNLYPKTVLESFESDNEIFLHKQHADAPTGFYSWGGENDLQSKQPLDIPLDDGRIIGLELEWSIGFTYTPSETAQLYKSMSEDMKYSLKYQHPGQTGGVAEKEFTLISSHFSSVGGRLVGECFGDELKGGSFDKHNDVCLMLSDGTQIPCTISINSQGYYAKEKRTVISAEVQYSDAMDGTITAIDLSKLEGIVINGAAYPLT